MPVHAPLVPAETPGDACRAGSLERLETIQPKIRLLTFTTLYPNAAMPGHGIFVENRLRHLIATGRVTSHVVAPVPWFPLSSPRFGKYASYAKVPACEQRHGIEIDHPRYPSLPKIGMSVSPLLLAAAMRPAIAALLRRGEDFDIIDAHYFYPDGVAATLLGASLGKPVVITARGTDLNAIPTYLVPRKWIQWAAARAAGLVTVSRALKGVLMQLGVPDERIHVLRNGVDLGVFRPAVDREHLRKKLGMTGPSVLSVGHLVKIKGYDIVVKAVAQVSEVHLYIAGDGPERRRLGTLARSLGIHERVTFLGAIEHHRLPDYYGAADALVLASSREGWPNVVLEALACGTPVISTNVGGTAEIITRPEAGVLISERNATTLAHALTGLLRSRIDRALTRGYAEQFSWDATSMGQLELFARVLQRP